MLWWKTRWGAKARGRGGQLLSAQTSLNCSGSGALQYVVGCSCMGPPLGVPVLLLHAIAVAPTLCHATAIAAAAACNMQCCSALRFAPPAAAGSVQVIVKTSAQSIDQASSATATAVAQAAASVCSGARGLSLLITDGISAHFWL